MASNSLVPPEGLKQIKHYLTLASQLDAKEEKCIPYYCRLYAIQYGMSINKSAPECKKFLLQLMDLVEGTKSQYKNDEAIQSQIVGQACFERYALSIFHRADDDDRESRFSKNLVKQFFTAGLLFDVLNFFGELSDDLVAKKQYAKRKAMYLNRCFQTGETPVPGPVGDGSDNNYDEGNNEGDAHGSTGQNYQAPDNNYPSYQPTTSNIDPNPRPASSRSSVQPTSPPKYQPTESSNAYYEQPSSSATLPPELLQKAQKFCKYATSALQYEDVQTAIKNLEDCLRILKTGKP